ncbi:MAG: RNA methyltransferase [Patescibacteria group bacterium]|nr:RNA methyltransferase [Patescibacteria group bacterium]MDD5715564.1 RNA methyltransferase [Patescibacteria group bacterium]
MQKKHDIVLILHNVRSRFNVGAIFRTADAAGVKKIYLCGITPAPPHPKIDKVALGAQQFIPFEKHRQTVRLIKQLKAEGQRVVAIEQSHSSIPYYHLKNKKPLVLIVGAEVRGLPAKILKLCDKTVEIPMYGKKESLNVAVALGIVIFDIIQQ